MHEFSLTQNLLDLALKNAEFQTDCTCKFIDRSFSEEREESIEFYWKDLAKGSLGEGAELHFEQLQSR